MSNSDSFGIIMNTLIFSSYNVPNFNASIGTTFKVYKLIKFCVRQQKFRILIKILRIDIKFDTSETLIKSCWIEKLEDRGQEAI